MIHPFEIHGEIGLFLRVHSFETIHTTSFGGERFFSIKRVIF